MWNMDDIQVNEVSRTVRLKMQNANIGQNTPRDVTMDVTISHTGRLTICGLNGMDYHFENSKPEVVRVIGTMLVKASEQAQREVVQ
jgi:hypothetical protein